MTHSRQLLYVCLGLRALYGGFCWAKLLWVGVGVCMSATGVSIGVGTAVPMLLYVCERERAREHGGARESERLSEPEFVCISLSLARSLSPLALFFCFCVLLCVTAGGFQRHLHS